MITQREKDDTKTTKELPEEFRIRLADYLESRAVSIEQASTERHIELLGDVEEELTIVRSVADQHQAVVRRISEELKNPKALIDDYRLFGKQFATTAVVKRLSLRDAIDGILFLKSEMLQAIADGDFLLEISSADLKSLMDFIGTRTDVLFAELAVSYHRNFTEVLQGELTHRERQNRQKDLFIRIASHEIRTPLATALALCELEELQGAQEGHTAKTTHPSFAEIRVSLNLINRHLSQLLDMSLLEDDKIGIKKEHTELPELLQRIKLSFERVRKDSTILFTHPTQLPITTDPDKVDQIISNLLHNAAKYSPRGSTIELSLTKKGADALIAVTDSGKGIPEENLETIFDPYARLSSNDPAIEGLGLGLYICRTLARALGGTLTVKSTVNSGSTFTLTLPLNAEALVV